MLVDFLERAIETTSIETLWKMHCEVMDSYGFDRLLYGFTRFRTANSFGDHDDMLLLSNHPPEYVERFIDGGLYFHAPMVRWAAANSGACSWRWLEENAEAFTKDEREVLEFNRKMGVRAGYSVSFKDSSVRNKGAIALTAREGIDQDGVEEIWTRYGRELVVMNTVVHLKLTNLPYSAGRKLTQRQRQTLEWVGDGKTTQDIACIMGLTTATVEKHLRLAREALDVDTTAQAVLKASFQNQIFVLEA